MKIEKVPGDMPESLERMYKDPFYFEADPDLDAGRIHFINQCLEEVDPGAKEALMLARKMYEK